MKVSGFFCFNPVKKTAGIDRLFWFLRQSGLGGSADGAGICTGAALDAGFGIDLILTIAFADRGDRALGGTGAAADAFIGNLVSHRTNLLIMLT